MSVQRIPDRLVAVNITAGETFSWKRAGTDMLAVSDTTAITFSSVGGYSPLRIAPSIKPVNVSVGDMWISSSSGLPFIYDSRNKFLGLTQKELSFKREQNGPLRLVVNFNPEKVNAPNNLTLIGYRVERNLNPGTINIGVFVNSTNVLTVTLSAAQSTNTVNNLNINVNKGDLIEVKLDSSPSNTANKAYIDLYYRENE